MFSLGSSFSFSYSFRKSSSRHRPRTLSLSCWKRNRRFPGSGSGVTNFNKIIFLIHIFSFISHIQKCPKYLHFHWNGWNINHWIGSGSGRTSGRKMEEKRRDDLREVWASSSFYSNGKDKRKRPWVRSHWAVLKVSCLLRSRWGFKISFSLSVKIAVWRFYGL